MLIISVTSDAFKLNFAWPLLSVFLSICTIEASEPVTVPSTYLSASGSIVVPFRLKVIAWSFNVTALPFLSVNWATTSIFCPSKATNASEAVTAVAVGIGFHCTEV